MQSVASSYPKFSTDRREWREAKTVGDVAENLIADFFRQLGLAVRFSEPGEAHDLVLGGRIECKHDCKASTSGAVAIETSFRGRASGITSTDASTWAILVDDVAHLISTPRLRLLIADLADIPAGEGATIRLLPLPTLRANAQCFRLGVSR